MKRPGCVTSAMVVMGLILGMTGLQFAQLQNIRSLSDIIFLLIFIPGIHLIGFLALLLRARWARIYSIIIFSLWAGGITAMAIFHYIREKQVFTLIPMVVMIGFIVWLIYSLIVSKEAKNYFARTPINPEELKE